MRVGIDVGSTTVKAVVLDGDEVVFADYRRHLADVRGEVARLLDDLAQRLPRTPVTCAVTGSGGLALAEVLGADFVQEVIAETHVAQVRHPDADVIIELGGEDAKITYLGAQVEQRMNGTCAGGTGAFIDQMASLLRTDAAGLDALAARFTRLYPIASRCGVFAKSDLQPLINDGAPPEDLAASIFQAVATQTVAGLACGRPIRGRVMFLGGPLHFLPELRRAFERVLGDKVEAFTTPPDAQLYVAIGAAMLAASLPATLPELADRLGAAGQLASHTARMDPLFASDDELGEFTARHRRAVLPTTGIERAQGPCYLGLDAGSTTIKAVVIDERFTIVFSHYATNDADPLGSAIDIVRRIHAELPAGAHIARSCVTGYGEGLIKAGLHLDDGEVETIAHFRAADHLCPGVSAVIDIGGQDMKYLRIHDSVIDSIAVNEACSSGCGSFLQTFAATLGVDLDTFTTAALNSFAPVDLGSRCTVFMNSSVKQAQKEGASLGDISAGLAYAVVRNALTKVIKLRDTAELGDKIVVQGGTFLNAAVLRAFELLTGREVVRPDAAGLMGAFGAALIARDRHHSLAGAPATQASTLLPIAALNELRVETTASTCRLCHNHCQCTISTFSDGERHVSGNRCERGADETRPPSSLPNLFAWKYKRLFAQRRLREADATRGDIGIPRALNMFENYPLWFTILTRLGFRVLISPRSNHDLFEAGMDTIASENVCYPAKLTHGHIAALVAKGVTTIFYPSISYERRLIDSADNHYNCPVVTGYPAVIANNVTALRDAGVTLIAPFLSLADPDHLASRLTEVFAPWQVTLAEARQAVQAGFAADDELRREILAEGARALRFLAETGTKGIVLAGRPYHVDPEIHHGIAELITSLGMAVLSEDAVVTGPVVARPLRVRDQWAYHTRLYEAAAVVAANPNLELVQLTSFGCGLDAITSDQVAEILAARGKVYTALKIDEVSNLGAARIRLRSLQAALRERDARDSAQGSSSPAASALTTASPGTSSGADARTPSGTHVREVPRFTKAARATHTIVAPQMAPTQFSLFEAVMRRHGYQVDIQREATRADIELGLTYVHNDACFPALVVIGQLVGAFRSGRYDPDHCTVAITQTGGMCRATNYTALLRKALAEAGYPHVPVLAISTMGIERHPGFRLGPGLVHHLLQAVIVGDLLQSLLLRVRPYEAIPGSANELHRTWERIAREFLGGGRAVTQGRAMRYPRLIEDMVAAFDNLPLADVARRPRVGVVGEILVKFHPDANNHLIEVIEAEGCEAVVPGLTEFMVVGMYGAEFNRAALGVGSRTQVAVKKAARALVERYREPARRALRARGGKFFVPGRTGDLAVKASSILSLGNQAGEGWLLTGEMIELIEEGVPNIVCAQPFACLPNHVVGRGMFAEVRRQYPEANITSIDYDPGASEVNQLNRIKLLLSSARRAHDEHVGGQAVSSKTGHAGAPHDQTGASRADWEASDS